MNIFKKDHEDRRYLHAFSEAVMKPNSRDVDALPTHYTIGLGELATIVWRRKLCLAVCVLATLALGGVYYLKADRVYEVKCRLLVEKQGLPLGEQASSQRTFRDLEFLGTQAEILGSPAVIASAVDQIQWPVATTSGVSPVMLLKERISVRPVMGTNVLSVSLQADNAERAVQAIHALIDSYRGYMSQAQQDVHLDVLEMLAKNEKEVRSDLATLEKEYRELRERSPLVASSKNGLDIQLAHIDELGRKLAETRGRRVELENQLRIAATEASKARALAEASHQQRFVNTNYVQSATGDVSAETVLVSTEKVRPVPVEYLLPQTIVGANLPGAPDIAAIQSQLVRAKVLEKELYSRFGPKHPEIRGVAEQIASLVREEQKALQAGHDLLRRELETVTANEQRLAELCKSEMHETKQLDSFQLQEQQLVSQLTRVQTVHESLVSQLRQWKLTGQIVSDGRAPIRISVLEAPVVPLSAAWPSLRIIFGICLAVGSIAGFGLIAFLEQRSRTARHLSSGTDGFATHTPRPVLGRI